MDRTARSVTGQCRRVMHHAGEADAYSLFNLLTGPELFDKVESLLPEHRERLYPPSETLSIFVAQALSSDRSWQKAVDEVAVRRVSSGLSSCSTHTGGYCRARARLPLEMVRELARYTGQWISAHAAQPRCWRGRAVRLVDGTTLTLPDTTRNQARFPQSRSQKPGLGFPLCRVVGILCLGSGALLDAAIGPFRGKGADEGTLLRSILGSVEHGEVLLGDAYFCTYFLLCSLVERGCDALFEQNGARRMNCDFRRGQRLGERDHLIVLPKPVCKPDWMTQAAYDQAPDQLTVRELRVGHKTLVTTLLCPRQSTKAELKRLYRRRWNIELDLRNIKTTLGMERLSCVSPDMAIKEMWVYLLAYNLIRLMMAQSARLADCLPRQLSFKHTVQIWLAWCHYGSGAALLQYRCALFELIAQQRVGNRPGRLEPRMLKRRPKPYTWLTKTREQARVHIRKHGHPKKAK
jgi:hypothetical protein